MGDLGLRVPYLCKAPGPTPEFVLLYFSCHCQMDVEVLVLMGSEARGDSTSWAPMVGSTPGMTQGKHGILLVISCFFVNAGLLSSSPLACHPVEEFG